MLFGLLTARSKNCFEMGLFIVKNCHQIYWQIFKYVFARFAYSSCDACDFMTDGKLIV